MEPTKDRVNVLQTVETVVDGDSIQLKFLKLSDNRFSEV